MIDAKQTKVAIDTRVYVTAYTSRPGHQSGLPFGLGAPVPLTGHHWRPRNSLNGGVLLPSHATPKLVSQCSAGTRHGVQQRLHTTTWPRFFRRQVDLGWLQLWQNWTSRPKRKRGLAFRDSKGTTQHQQDVQVQARAEQSRAEQSTWDSPIRRQRVILPVTRCHLLSGADTHRRFPRKQPTGRHGWMDTSNCRSKSKLLQGYMSPSAKNYILAS